MCEPLPGAQIKVNMKALFNYSSGAKKYSQYLVLFLRQKLQECVYVLILKQGDGSINWTNLNVSVNLFAEPFAFGGDTATPDTISSPV